MQTIKIIFTTLTISMLIACGGNSKQDNETREEALTSKEIMQQEAQEAKNNPQESEASENDAEVVEITIEGNDQMQFNLDEIKVEAGVKVKLTLKHTGKFSVEQMGHNWVLLKQGTDKMDFGQKAATAKDSNYIPSSENSKVIAHTEMLGGGESDTIEFTAPEKGTYDFICSFPGHVAIMQGKFIVE